jgi:cytochrome b6-f complex iron-sulfur subunit
MSVSPGLPSRRTVLTVGAGAAAVGVLSACSAGGATAPSPAPTTSTGPLASLTDIADGGAIVVQDVLLARKGDTVIGHSAVCTHQGCTVAAPQTGDQLTCPCHGSEFNAVTGAVLRGPASAPLPEIAVTVKKGEIFRA